MVILNLVLNSFEEIFKRIYPHYKRGKLNIIYMVKRIKTKFYYPLTMSVRRVRRVVLWIPIFSLLIGSGLSVAIYVYLKDREFEAQKKTFQQRAQEAVQQLDLELLNSFLRIQTYEDFIGLKPTNNINDGAYIVQALNYTIFHRLAILRDINPKNLPKKASGLRVLDRIDRSQSELPPVTSKMVQSEAVIKAVEELKKKSSYYKTVLHQRNGLVLASAVMQSKNNKDIFFVFTLPLATLFSKIDFKEIESIVIRDVEQKTSWVINETDPKKAVRKDFNFTLNFDKAESHYSFIFEKGLPQSGVNLGFEFNFAPVKTDITSAANIAGLMSVFITLIVSYLFYVLTTLNKKSQRMIVNKTLDLEKTAHDLQEALKGKTKFLGKISHEIRTPLNLILGIIDLCEEIDVDKKLSQYLKSMKASGEHLLSMIDDLLDLAKAESNDFNLQGKNTHFVQFLSDVAKMNHQECESKGLNFYTYFSPQLPAVVVCDPNRLRQVLLNLLRNACKYTNSGYISLNVTLHPDSEAEARFSKIRFEIKDTGLGIPKDKLGRVFDAFFQVEHSSTYAEGGVGLGLSIVKDIVNKMGGKVDVHSTLNSGTTFCVDLELEVFDRTPWVEVYKAESPQLKSVIVLSDDPLILRSLEPLTQHPFLKLHFLDSVTFESAKRDLSAVSGDFIVVDLDSAGVTIEKALQKWSSKVLILIGKIKDPSSLSSASTVSVLSRTPLLASELLNHLGFSSRSRVRELNRSIIARKSNEVNIETINKDLKIIVADDDVGNIELYKAYFAKVPWSIRYGMDGAEALNFYQLDRSDLLILDVRMPNIDGFGVIEKIREKEKADKQSFVPIILVTADLLDYTVERAKKFDNVTLLTKPLKKSILFEQITKVL